MFTESISPRFSETDALGHINNTTVPVWLEQARTPIFRMFIPDLDPKHWRLIIAKIEVEFYKEMLYGSPVQINTYIEKVGRTSFHIGQEVFQHEQLCAKGLSVAVHFNYASKKAEPIPDSIRLLLKEHLMPPPR